MIRTGDGGGARRELRSSPTVPAQRGTGGCVPHDCDLVVAGMPADGASCRYCHGVTHTARNDARNDGRDVPEPVRPAHRCQCRGNSVYTITGRRSLGLDPPEFPRFLADRGQAGQLSPSGTGCAVTASRSALEVAAIGKTRSSRPPILAGAIRSPRRARCPDPAPLTTTPAQAPGNQRGRPCIRACPHTAPALFTTDVPATLAGRR
jgi:hypothetical protein